MDLAFTHGQCKACGHVATDFSYTDEDRAAGYKTASGFGHGFAGDMQCKCGCKQTPAITRLEEEIAWRLRSLEVEKVKAELPWKPYVCLL